MQCETVRRLLPFAVELDDADRAALDAHLGDCPDCTTLARAERDADAGVRRAMSDIAIPAGLRGRIDRSLALSRSFWWRKRVAESAAVAVALLLTVGLVRWSLRPTLDATAIVQATYEQAGLWRTAEEGHTSADDWLHWQDARLHGPADLDYTLLAFVGRADFSGLKSVPSLTLVRPKATARIYFVRAAAFKSLGEAAEQPVEVGGCTVAVRRYDDLPGWLVIVVTGGGPVELFLRTPAAAGPA